MGEKGPPHLTFEEAFPSLRLMSFRAAYRLLGNIQDAEDASSEALARTLRHWKKVRSLSYRDAWVVRVTCNVAIDMTRKRRPDPVKMDIVPHVVDQVDDQLMVVESLRRLPSRQCEAVVMRFVADLSETQAAEALGISVNTLKTHTQRGLTALRLDHQSNTISIDLTDGIHSDEQGAGEGVGINGY